MHLALSILLNGNEIWTLRTEDKEGLTALEMNFSEEQPGTSFFLPQKEQRNFGRAGSRTSRRQTRKAQIKLATTCDKNEQQDAKK